MRITSYFSLLALLTLTGCTVKNVDAPALAGPSTLANNLILRSNTDTLIQDGVSQAVITITATDANGNNKNIPLRADITVGGVVQDYGRLNTKTPTANGTPLIYTAPPASSLAAGQVSQVVTIVVTPMDAADFRSEVPRQIDIRLVPMGVILPSNPTLQADFVPPASPKVLDNLVFDATPSKNNGVACGTACTYAWDFGDGTSGSGQSTTHQYRTVGTYQAKLTVTDVRGAQAIKIASLNVAVGTPPTANFTVSPSSAIGLNQTIFFNASSSLAATGRTIVSYQWDFGRGTTGTGVTVTKSYDTAGTYQVTLTVTDDAGAIGQKTSPVTVTAGAGNPTAEFVFSPAAPKSGQPVFFDAQSATPASTGAPIVSYRWTWGDNSSDSESQSQTSTHTFTVVGGATTTYNVRLTVTDSQGRTGTVVKPVSITP